MNVEEQIIKIREELVDITETQVWILNRLKKLVPKDKGLGNKEEN